MADDGRVITGRPVTVAAAFADEQPAMLPLPAEPLDPAPLLQGRVDGRARGGVRLPATAVEVPGGPRVVARHERAAGKYAETLVLTTTWRCCGASPARC